VVKKAQRELGHKARFIYMDLSKPHVANRIAPKYHVARIPAIVPITGERPQGCASLYWVGIPDHDDLCGVMRYLISQSELADVEKEVTKDV
jgi:hypothetical protein